MASSNSYSYDAGNMINDGKLKYDYSDGDPLIAFKTLAATVRLSPVAGQPKTEAPSVKGFFPSTRHARSR